jgi:hypothetical protein
MTTEAHIAELDRRRLALKEQLEEALKHKSVDDLEIVELKRQKLHIKDEIQRLRHS